MAGVKKALLSEVTPPVESTESKVTIVGVGQVGMAVAFSILTQVGKCLKYLCLFLNISLLIGNFYRYCFDRLHSRQTPRRNDGFAAWIFIHEKS